MPRYRSHFLLSAIYQHLVANGYTGTARELETENGEKFSVPKVSLKEIYKHWIDYYNETNSSKKSSGRKKARVQDPTGSRESNDDYDGAGPASQPKKGSSKKAAKIKTQPKKMNSAKKSATKVRKTEKSSDESDSDEEMAPVQETALKSKNAWGAAAVLKSKTSSATDSEPTKHGTPAKSTPTAASKKRLSTSNGKSLVKNDTEESSESSEETDIEKQPAAVTPVPSSLKASKEKLPTPSTPAQPKADTSESSESESEEEETQMSAPATPWVKVAKSTVTQTKATVVTPASMGSPAAGKTPTKMVKDNSSQPAAVTPVPSSLKASQEKLPTPSTPAQPKADTSESSESESEEEEAQMSAPATPRDKVAKSTVAQTKATVVTPASMGSPAAGKTPTKMVKDNSSQLMPTTTKRVSALQSKADDSSSSETESEEEHSAQNQKTPSWSKTASTEASKPNTLASAGADSSDTSSDSDSESEEKAPEKAAIVVSNVRTLVPSAKQPVATSPKAKCRTPPPAPADEASDTGDSDSDEEPGSKVVTKITSPLPASGVKTPTSGAKQPMKAIAGSAGNLLKAPADDSSESDDSDSDENHGVKTPTPGTGAAKGTAMARSTALTPASHGSAAAVRSLAGILVEETSEESDSDDEPSSAGKTAVPTTGTPLVKPPAVTPARIADSDADSESSDSSDSEEKTTPKTQVSAVASLTKTAATPSAASPSVTKEKTPATGKVTAVPMPSDETSESSDSSDEHLPSGQLQYLALLGSMTPKQTAAAKLSLQPEVAAQSKARSPAKTVADKKSAAAQEEESSDSSDSSDGEEKRADLPKKPDATVLAKHKLSIPTPLLTPTPSIASPAKGKAGLPAKRSKAVKTPQVPVTEKQANRVGTPASTPKAKRGTGSSAKTPKSYKVEMVKSSGRRKAAAAALKLATAEMSSDSSESNSSDEKSVTSRTPVSVQTTLESFFSKRVITPAKAKHPTDPASSSSETSGGDVAPVVKEESPATPKTARKKQSNKTLASPKSKGTSPAKTPSGAKQAAAESSRESSDGDDHLALKIKVASQEAAGKANDYVLGDELSKPAAHGKGVGSAEDSGASEPEESQSLLQVQTPKQSSKRKRSLDKVDKKHIAKPSKKSKVHAPPETPPCAPATPEEGRSTKKAKKNKTVAAATPTVRISTAEGKKHKAKSPAVPEPTQLSEKKSGKKRKSSSEDGDSKPKEKKKKKSEKEKKKSEKKKSEKEKKKKKDKRQKKESKTPAQSPIAPVGESTDSGVGLQSKHKKKKKVKGDKTG